MPPLPLEISKFLPLLIFLIVAPLVFKRLIRPVLRFFAHLADLLGNPESRKNLSTGQFSTLVDTLLPDDPPPVRTVQPAQQDVTSIGSFLSGMQPGASAEEAIEQVVNALHSGNAQVIRGSDLKGALGNLGNTRVISTVTVNGKPVSMDDAAVSGLLRAVGATLRQAAAGGLSGVDHELDAGQRLHLLQELHRSGALTDAEFEAKKARILREL